MDELIYKTKTSTRALISTILLVILILGGVFFQFYLDYVLRTPMVLDASKSIVIELQPGTSAKQLVKKLNAIQSFSSHRLLLWWMRLHGYSNSLQAGYYEIKSGDTREIIIKKIVNGDVLVEMLRLIEGTTLFDIQDLLKNAPYLKYSSSWLETIDSKHQHPEGLLLASTYFYKAGSSVDHLVNRAHSELTKILSQVWKTRAMDLPYRTPYELLVAASIIEKESALANERRLIASVIVNRLKKRMPLQMDPTVIYAMKMADPSLKHDIRLTHNDLKILSPYNTYVHSGLPPTPIAIVGFDAINAAAHPEVTNYLYYVARGDGSHQFSEYYQQQKDAIRALKIKRAVGHD